MELAKIGQEQGAASLKPGPHLKCHPLVQNLSWNPPLLLYISQTSLRIILRILLAHSSLFMGGTVLWLLNSLLLAL